jgi:hypothetical protein
MARYKSYYKRKVKDIRYNYGESAVQHFIANPICEHCGEERMVVLNIHHTAGKLVEDYKTLCHNCHMLEHNPRIAHETYATHLQDELEKAETLKKRDLFIVSLLEKQTPLRDIIGIAGCKYETIKRVMAEHGYRTRPQSGYYKICEFEE